MKPGKTGMDYARIAEVWRGPAVESVHFGTVAVLLRGRRADAFRARAAGATELELQHLMARATGNYKRGNE